MKQLTKTKLIYLVPPLAVIIIMLAVYAYNGFFPFGEKSIVAFDLYAGSFPGYVYAYDALHGAESLFYDFTTAGGFPRSMLFALTDTTNIFLYFFPRDMLFNAFSLLLIAKFSLISFTSFFSVKKLFPALDTDRGLLLSMLYTFSTYSLQYYTNIQWLDTVAVFPVLVLAAVSMLNGKSKVPYIILFSFIVITNTYFAFFCFLIFIVFGGLYIFVFREKNERKRLCFNLGISTGTVLAIGAYNIFSFTKGIFSTARLSETIETAAETGFFENLTSYGTFILINKVIMFIGTEFCFACLVLLFLHFKKEKKACLFFSLCSLLLILQCVVINVDLLWHGGSYNFFPFRSGFIVSFIMVCAAAYYLSKYGKERVIKSDNPVIRFAVPTVAAFSLIITAAFWNAAYNTLEGFDIVGSGGNLNLLNKAYIVPVLSVIAASFISSFLIALISSNTLRRVAVSGFLIACVLFQTVMLISVGLKKQDTYIPAAEKLYTDDKSTDRFERTINPDISLGYNYGYIANRSTISNWTHSLKNEQRKGFSELGFSLYYTMTLDNGGTVFSQALLNVKNAVNSIELPHEMYTKTDTLNNTGFYTCNYTLPLGLVFDSSLADVSADSCENLFEYQNKIYRALSGSNGSLFEREAAVWSQQSPSSITLETENMSNTVSAMKYSAEIYSSGKRAYYFYSADSDDIYELFTADGESSFYGSVSINGSEAEFDASGDAVSSFYKEMHTNNIVCLGVFEDEAFDFSLSLSRGTPETVIIYSVDLDKLAELCTNAKGSEHTTGKTSFSFNSYAENDGDYLFIPLTYCDNFMFTNNGEPVTAEKVLGSFTGIKLHAGENAIEMRYNYLSAFTPFVYIVSASAVTAAVFLFIRKKRIQPPPILERFTLPAFALISLGAITVLYIVPLIMLAVYGFTA